MSSITVFGAAICPENKHDVPGKVILNDDRTITVAGFESIGVSDGIYRCAVNNSTIEGKNRFSKLNCNQNSTFIWGWLAEGPAANGKHAAGVTLNTRAGIEFFQSGCVTLKK